MPDQQIRPFGVFLRELNDGETHDELSVALVELVEAVKACGKQGTLTFALKVAPAGRGSATVMVTDKITVKAPEAARAESVWFIDDNGNPVRHNPDQQKLPLREVPRPAVAGVNPETGEVAQ